MRDPRISGVQVPREFWESSNHGSWISDPWAFVNIIKIAFYELIKQTVKNTFVAYQSVKRVSSQQLLLLLQLMGIGLNNTTRKKNLTKSCKPKLYTKDNLKSMA